MIIGSLVPNRYCFPVLVYVFVTPLFIPLCVGTPP